MNKNSELRIAVVTVLLIMTGAAVGVEETETNGVHSSYESYAENVFVPATVRALVLQLGDQQFRRREEAQAALAKLPHAAIAFMREYADTEDPEIRQRLTHVISGIRTRPVSVPCQVLGWTTTNKQKYHEALKKWRNENVPSTGIGQSQIVLHDTRFAQSFKPTGNTVDAIAVGIFPVGVGDGWLRLDLHDDDNERPALEVLARCWIRIKTEGPVPQGSWTLFDLPDTMVKAKRTYWFIIHQHSDKGVQDSFCAWHMSDEEYPESKSYIDGKLWKEREEQPLAKSDACFHVYENSADFPLLRPATQQERQSLPDVAESNTGTGTF